MSAAKDDRDMNGVEIRWVAEVESTHNELKGAEYAAAGDYTVLAAVTQSRGRGQRGNGWEAEPGKNLTFSMVLHPVWLAPREQFSLSEAFALAVCALLGAHGIEACVKWPNDIYVGNCKICGILIDHSLGAGSIGRSVLSAGINVNQREFMSDAPNPVSMVQLTGREEALGALLREFVGSLPEYMELTRTKEGRDALHAAFMGRLYRGDGGVYPFYDAVRGERIEAAITGIAPGGELTLRPVGCEERSYLFKQVVFL